MPVTLVSGNTRTVYAAAQSAKGTAATTPTRKFHLTDETMDPGRSIIQLPETDSSSQVADYNVVGAEPGGTFGTWLRPNDCDILFYSLMQAVATTGTTNYTHTITPSVTPVYLTLWDVIPGVLTTKFVDCRVVSGAVTGQSGQGISVAWELRGLQALLGQTEPTLPAAFATDNAMTYPMVTVTRGGVHNGDVDAFSLTINRGGQYFLGDNGLQAADYVFGLFGIEGSLTLAFQNDQEYRAFNTGSTVGTNLTTTMYDQTLSILVSIDSTHQVTFTSQGVRYTSYPVPIDTGGAPIIVAAGISGKRQAVFGDYMTVQVKNQNTTPST